MIFADNNHTDILVVEDSLSNLRLLVDILELEGYQVRSAQTAVSALFFIDKAYPNLILLDIKMPGFDGFQLCKQLKANSKTAHIPIIFVSALDDINNLTEGFDMGAVDYITKPFHAKEVIARVRSHLMLATLNLKLEQQNIEIQQSLQQKIELDAQLLESEKMAALGRSVASITHELNTPLGLCVTATSYLQEKSKMFKKDLEQRELTVTDGREFIEAVDETLSIVMANLGRSTEMVNNFKTVAVDVSSEKLRTFALVDYLHRVINSISPELRKTQHKVDINSADLMISTYPGALSQVITNIVMNSIIHAFDDGDLGHITIDIKQKGDKIYLSCADDGKGMSPDSLNKIFEAYYTTQAGRGGSGLGTSIIKKLVTQKLQGQVSCTSELGGGTIFHIILPVKLESAST